LEPVVAERLRGWLGAELVAREERNVAERGSKRSGLDPF
jgi:hypothetical protein